MGRPHLLDVVEAAYDLDASPDDWQTAVVEQARRVFPDAIGALGYRYQLSENAPVLTSPVVGNSEFLEVPDEGHSQLDVEHIYRAYTVPSHAEPTTIFHADPVTGAVPDVLRTMWSRLGVSDMFGVYATRATGDSMTIGIAMPVRHGLDVRAHDWRPTCRQWTSLARHIENALAVREAFASGGVVADFDLHGAGDFRPDVATQRERVLEHAQQLEAVRTATGNDDARSPAVWDKLLGGRWSMIRYRRHGGGVRFLAVENPRTDVLRRLSPLERRVVELAAAGMSNKLIAAEIDLHTSSVANILTRALRKLGIDRRAYLPILARVLRAER